MFLPTLDYRLIVLNVLIYDLITTDIVIANDFDKSSASSMSPKTTATTTTRTTIATALTTLNSKQIAPATTIFMSQNHSSSRSQRFDIALADNCTAINENVDNFQNDDDVGGSTADDDDNDATNQIATYRQENMSIPANPPQQQQLQLQPQQQQQYDLLSTTLTSNFTMTIPKLSSTVSSLKLPAPVSTAAFYARTPPLSPSSATAVVAAAAGATADLLLHQSSLHSKWQRVLSRPKRYLAFPEGSSFSVAVCFTVGIIGNPRYNYMSFGLNWGVAYDLPNATWVLLNLHGLKRRPVPETVLHRRSRRSLYKEIENAVDNMGYNGRGCVLRTLCESKQYFSKTKMSMIGEMLRTIFSLPKQRIFTRELHENSDIELYDHAYRKARAVDCATQYDCKFSLLELAFGKYSTPPPGYYEQFSKAMK